MKLKYEIKSFLNRNPSVIAQMLTSICFCSFFFIITLLEITYASRNYINHFIYQTRHLSQILPITAQTQISGQLIQLEVATTPIEKTVGLMNRDYLLNNRGMVFI